jgi:glycosyltransferase involved in cell wall biosynthesis
MPCTTIVVPCFNEEARLDLLAFDRLSKRHPSIDFLFVDDGSTDRTPEMLAAFCGRTGGRHSWIQLPRNSGKAEAVRQGLLEAIRRRAEQVGFWDADLATPLEEIPRFASVLNRCPGVRLVIGSRMPLLGRQIRRPLRRWLLGRLFARVASWTIGLRVFDTQCGAKLFRVGSGLSELLAQPFSTRWIFDVEILARLRLACPAGGDIGIYECPLDAWHEVEGSKLKGRDFVRAGFELLNIWRRYRFATPQPQSWAMEHHRSEAA